MSPIQRVIGALQNRPETSETPESPKAEASEVKAEGAKPNSYSAGSQTGNTCSSRSES